ncbi:3-aminobutyryl-CoA ammonia lyase [Actinopolymorpha pittospori]
MSDPTDQAPRAATATDVTDSRLGLVVTHRRYVSYAESHYAGNLVAGGYVLGLFGDVATEVCIRTDGDEGLLASYAEVRFLAPVHAGDVLEVRATVVRVGNRSRDLELEARVVARGESGRGGSGRGESAAGLLEPPLLAVTARATVVVPASS